MKILVTDYAWNDLQIEQQILSSVNALLVAAKSGTEDELVALAANTEGIFTKLEAGFTEGNCERAEMPGDCPIRSRTGQY